jgi:tRNA 2-thiouridine synthesizing protein A
MTIDKLEISQRIDSRGMSCPMPIVRTAQAMAMLQTGQLLEVVAYQPKSVAEFTAWSKSTGNPLIESSVQGGIYRFVFRKK